MLTFKSAIVQAHIAQISCFFENQAKGLKDTLKINGRTVLVCDGTQDIDYNNENARFQDFDYEGLVIAFASLEKGLRDNPLTDYEKAHINEMIELGQDCEDESPEYKVGAIDEAFCEMMKDNVEWVLDDPEFMAFVHEWNSEAFYEAVFSAMTNIVGLDEANEIVENFLTHEREVYARDYESFDSDYVSEYA